LVLGCAQTFAAASRASLSDAAQWAGIALPDAWRALTLAQFAPLIPYLLLIVVLACRARGLFGERADV
ncbi:branched-chain amino acid ABC transporter permease, partial [Burkholderia pseudomallei]